MIEIDPLDELLTRALLEMARVVPDEAKAIAEYLRLEKLSAEVDERGVPTKAAHRAKTRLDNPFMVEETPKRSRAKVEKQEQAAHAKFAKSIMEAVKNWAVHRQYQRKIAILDAHEERRDPIKRTREDHDPESIFALGYPFLETLAAQKVSPSSIGRLPQFAKIFIADLIKAHARDPKLKDPKNIWNLIVRSGVLSAYREDLSEDEQKVIAHAASCRDGEAIEWARKARVELDLSNGFSGNFLEGAALLAVKSRELTAGEAAAYNDAFGLEISRDVELLAKVLNLDAADEAPLLTALVHFISKVRSYDVDSQRLGIQLMAIKQSIDRIEPAQKLKRDWVAELINLLPNLAVNLSNSVDSIAAFDALLTGGLHCSVAKLEFADRKTRQEQKIRSFKLAEEVRDACESGTTFKVAEGRVIWTEDLEFDEIEAEEWTEERWLEVYGAMPNQVLFHDVDGSFDVENAETVEAFEPNDHRAQKFAEQRRVNALASDPAATALDDNHASQDDFRTHEAVDPATDIARPAQADLAFEEEPENTHAPGWREETQHRVSFPGDEAPQLAEASQTDPSEDNGASTNSSAVTEDVADPQDRPLRDKCSPRPNDASEEFEASIGRKRRAERYPKTLLDELDDEDLR